MTRISIISFFCCIFCLQGMAQAVKPVHEHAPSLSRDTALVNHYVKIIQPLAVNKHTLDSAGYYLQKIYKLSQDVLYKKGLAEYYRLLAVVYNTRHLYDSAMPAVKEEFYWSRQTGIPDQMIESYASMGIIYEHEDELDSAAKYYIRALHISDSIQDQKLSGMLDNNLSILFEEIGDKTNGIKYAKEGYRYGKALNDSLIFVNCLFNLAGNEYDLKKYDTAKRLYMQVKNITRNSVKYNMVPQADIMLASIYSDQGNNSKSLAMFRELLQHGKYLSPYVKLTAYENMGNTLYLMKQFAAADKNISQALQIAKGINARSEIKNNYRDLAQVKEAEKQFAAALSYRKLYDSLKDTLISESTQKNMHLLQTKYQTVKKDNQITRQSLELSNKQRAIERKNTWMWIIFCSLVVLAIIFMLSRRSYRHKQKLHQQKLLTLQKQHEVNTLKTKMDTREEERNRIGREIHDDVGSALTTILYLSDDLKSETRKDGKQTAARIADTAGSVVDKMNEIIWSMNREYDTLDDLIAYTRQHAAEFLDNYNLEYRFDTPDPVPDIRLQGEQRRNIYLVIKETLHNVVKHACATEVHINFHLNDNLTVTIHDNGKGINAGELRRFGNGLRNMKQRMESIGGSLDIAANQGTDVILNCPLEQKQDREIPA